MSETGDQMEVLDDPDETKSFSAQQLLIRTGILLFMALVLHMLSFVSFAWRTESSNNRTGELIGYPLLLAPFTLPGAFGMTARSLLSWMPVKGGEVIAPLCICAFWPLVVFCCFRWIVQGRLVHLLALGGIGILTAINWHMLSIALSHV